MENLILILLLILFFTFIYLLMSRIDQILDRLRKGNLRMEQQRIDSKAQNMMYDVGRLVAMRRNSMGLSHGHLAELSRVPEFEIRQLEFGNFDYMSAQNIFRLMAALRLELNVFPF